MMTGVRVSSRPSTKEGPTQIATRALLPMGRRKAEGASSRTSCRSMTRFLAGCRFFSPFDMLELSDCNWWLRRKCPDDEHRVPCRRRSDAVAVQTEPFCKDQRIIAVPPFFRAVGHVTGRFSQLGVFLCKQRVVPTELVFGAEWVHNGPCVSACIWARRSMMNNGDLFGCKGSRRRSSFGKPGAS